MEMKKVKIYEKSGRIKNLPFKLQNNPASLIFTVLLVDRTGNVGECGVVIRREDADSENGIFFIERSFGWCLYQGVFGKEERITFNGKTYEIVCVNRERLDALLQAKREEQAKLNVENAKEQNECVDYLTRERKVKYLVHFTPIPNLEGISRYGIVPVDSLPPDVVPIRLDKDRLDNHLDFSSFSIAFPSYQQLYKKRNDNPDISFAVLTIDVDALRGIEYQNTIFAFDNAASKLMPLDQMHGLEACRSMFRDDAVDSKGNSISREDLHIPDYYTTYPQAEIMVKGIIEPEFIHGIDVVNMKDKELAYLYLTDEMKTKITVSGRFFNSRSDYKFWSKYGNQTGI